MAILRRYVNTACIHSESDLPIFGPLRFYWSINRYKLYGLRRSYTRCKEIFKECLKDLGHDHSEYGLHSLRSEGATAAVNNGHTSERLLKIFGRWDTDIVKDMYVQESLNSRLYVTNNLGL